MKSLKRLAAISTFVLAHSVPLHAEIPPSVVSISPDALSPVGDNTDMNYTVVFSEPVTGFTNIFDIVTVTTNTTGAIAPLNVQTADNITYTFAIRPRIVDGQISGTVALSIAQDSDIIDSDGMGLSGANPVASTVTFTANAYQIWAINQLLTPGSNFNYSSDPDSDGRINGEEFVRNTNPLVGDNPLRQVFHLAEIDGKKYGVLTVATRTGTTYHEPVEGWLQGDFSGGGQFIVDVADNIRTTADLLFTFSGNPTIVVDPTVSDPIGLPTLDPGWSWYHFRYADDVSTQNIGFFRAEIEDLD